MYYTVKGSVRGECPHMHRTVNGALSCLRRDQADCRAAGGYSDRSIYQVEDETETPVADPESEADFEMTQRRLARYTA